MTLGVARTRLKQLDTFANATGQLAGINERANVSALIGVGDLMRKRTRSYIAKQGNGTWDKPHALSRRFRKGKSDKLWKRRTSRKPLQWLGKYVRFIAQPRTGSVRVSLSRENKPRAFKESFRKLAEQVQKKREIKVTEKIRGKFAATQNATKVRKARKGASFFPLRKSTKSLKIPERKIFDPVFSIYKNDIPNDYERLFVQSFNRNLKRRGLVGFFISRNSL